MAEIFENIITQYDDSFLTQLGQVAWEEYKIDWDANRSNRILWNEGMDLALQSPSETNKRWNGAAMFILPIVTKAALNYAARSYPNIIRDGNVCKFKVTRSDVGKPTGMIDPRNLQPIYTKAGELARRGSRMSTMINFQCMQEMENWDEDTDKLLYAESILGSMFRKTWFDPLTQKACSSLVFPQHYVIHPNTASMKTCPRKTHEIDLYPYEIDRRIESGYFIPHDYRQVTSSKREDKPLGETPARTSDNWGNATNENDTMRPVRYLEQQRFISGFPVIVTLFEPTRQVVRIVRNYTDRTMNVTIDGQIIEVNPLNHFTHYKFLENPSGSIYGVGWSTLLAQLNKGGNTLLRQLIDAGTLNNIPGGFIEKGVRLRGGEYKFAPGKWTFVEAVRGTIKESFYPLPTKEPSATLFELLKFVMEYANSLAGMSDILEGELRDGMKSNAMLGQLEQALAPFKSQFKRTYRALGEEFRLMAGMNEMFLSPQKYQTVLGEPADPKKDFANDGVGVIPVADMDSLTNIQKIMKIEALKAGIGDSPYVNRYVLDQAYVDALNFEGAQDLLYPPEAVQMAQQQDQAKQDGMIQSALGIEAKKAQGEYVKDVADAALKISQKLKVEAETDNIISGVSDER